MKVDEDTILVDLRKRLGKRLMSHVIPRKRRVFIKVNEKGYKIAAEFLREKFQARLVAVTGVDAPLGFQVIYHFDIAGILTNVQTSIPRDTLELETIADIIPSAYLYEREVTDLFGIKFRDRRANPRMSVASKKPPKAEYPLESVRARGAVSSSSRVIIGPFHPWLDEPEQLEIIADGTKIVDVRINIGYITRGIEKLVESRTFHQAVAIVERVCGICSNIHPLCFTQAVEDITKVKTPDRARYIRTIISELERIHSHMLYLGLEAEKTGAEDLFARIFSERERVMDIFETVTGNRVHYGILELGGVRRDINEKKAAMITSALDNIDSDMQKIEDAFQKKPSIAKIIEGKGVLTREEAKKLDVVGPNARASGLSLDIRKLDPYAAYPEIDFNVVTRSEGDVKARLMVRIDEILESSRIIRNLLGNIPRGPIAVPVLEIPKGEAVGRGEAPRGENMYYVRSNGSLYPERVKIRTPTLANLVALKPMLMDESTTEPVILNTIIASIDPCFSCTDRMAIIENGKVVKKGRLIG